MSPSIRPATLADVPTITRIYAHAVLHGTASFELEPPTQAEMEKRMRALLDGGFPYFVAEIDGKVAGYAYASLYRTRPAYRFTVEDSIYVGAEVTGRGIGRALLASLIERCAAAGLRQMVAVIGDSANAASIGLHAKLGFARVGLLPAVGFKLGRWVDSVIMQRPLGDGATSPPL